LPHLILERFLNESKRIVGTCLDLLFPPRCVGCNRPGAFWCQECIQSVATISGRLCVSCGLPLKTGNTCSSCQMETFPYQVRSYAWYREPLRRALLHLKYRPDRRLSDWFAERLAEIVERESWPHMTVLSVPLSKNKHHRRGYNQVDLVASSLARKLDLSYKPKTLRRIRDTQSQVGLSAEARKYNVQGAFVAEYQQLQGECILLIDDLYTTGATLAACAQALKRADARQIFALTIARADHSDIVFST
jgi:competence protein ComFC